MEINPSSSFSSSCTNFESRQKMPATSSTVLDGNGGDVVTIDNIKPSEIVTMVAAKNAAVVVVGSRKSQLALIQTHTVIDRLTELHRTPSGLPAVEFRVESMSTTGDQRTDVALHKLNEKNLWTKELETAMLNKTIAFAVHSLKDLPTILPDGLVIAAILRRENAQDAVVLHPRHIARNVKTLRQLPPGSVLGTSSLRRIAELTRAFPHLTFKDVRGNLNTRLAKLDDGSSGCDALILAAAGLMRMQWTSRIAQILSPHECMHAVGQGALAVECCLNDSATLNLLEPLNDFATVMCCLAERAFLKHLEGGCSVPCAVYTNFNHELNVLTIRGGVYSLDGTCAVEHAFEQALPAVGALTENGKSTTLDERPRMVLTGYVVPHSWQNAAMVAHSTGTRLAECLQQQGATEILVEARQQSKVLQKLHDIVIKQQHQEEADKK